MKWDDPRVGIAISVFSVLFSTVALIMSIYSMITGA
jgi:hypothetical protein